MQRKAETQDTSKKNDKSGTKLCNTFQVLYIDNDEDDDGDGDDCGGDNVEENGIKESKPTAAHYRRKRAKNNQKQRRRERERHQESYNDNYDHNEDICQSGQKTYNVVSDEAVRDVAALEDIVEEEWDGLQTTTTTTIDTHNNDNNDNNHNNHEQTMQIAHNNYHDTRRNTQSTQCACKRAMKHRQARFCIDNDNGNLTHHNSTDADEDACVKIDNDISDDYTLLEKVAKLFPIWIQLDPENPRGSLQRPRGRPGSRAEGHWKIHPLVSLFQTPAQLADKSEYGTWKAGVLVVIHARSSRENL